MWYASIMGKLLEKLCGSAVDFNGFHFVEDSMPLDYK